MFSGDLFQFTPLGRISPKIIEPKLSKRPIRLFIPMTPLPSLELKYPLVQSIRFILSLSIAVGLSYLIMTVFIQDLFTAQVLDRFLPAEDITVEIESNGNLFDRLRGTVEDATDAAQNLLPYAEREAWRFVVFTIFVGGSVFGFVGRAVFIYFLISGIYLTNQTDWRSSEHILLREKVTFADLGKKIYDEIFVNFQGLVSDYKIDPQTATALDQIKYKLKRRRDLSQEDMDTLLNTYLKLHLG